MNVYGLFNDADRSSDDMQLNGGMISEYKILYWHLPKGTKKTHGNFHSA
jgi:hypothetical protein